MRKIDSLIGNLVVLALAFFLIHEFIYYNVYLYGNMDTAFQLDFDYSFDVATFMGQENGTLGYTMLGVYICLIIAIFLFISHYKVHKGLAILWIGMCLWCLVTLAHSAEPFLYVSGITALSNTMAPGTVALMSCALLFTKQAVWEQFSKNIKYVIIFAFILSVYGFIHFPYSFDENNQILRLFSFKWIKGPVGCLMLLLPFAYTFYNQKNCKFQTVIFVMAFIGAILMQSRMSIISLFVMYFLMNYMVKDNNAVPDPVRKNIQFIYKIMVFFVTIVLIYMLFDSLISIFNINNKFLNIFFDRVSDDTRSSQYINHLPIVLQSLPMGIGYPSTSVLRDYASYGIDNGLLMMMYYCGLPMLILFVAYTYPPVIKAVRLKGIQMEDISIITIGLGRLIWLLSSFTPSLSIGLVMLMVAVGRSKYLLDIDSIRRNGW